MEPFIIFLKLDFPGSILDSPKNLLSIWDNFHSVPAVTVDRLSHYQLTVNCIIQDIINDRESKLKVHGVYL